MVWAAAIGGRGTPREEIEVNGPWAPALASFEERGGGCSGQHPPVSGNSPPGGGGHLVPESCGGGLMGGGRRWPGPPKPAPPPPAHLPLRTEKLRRDERQWEPLARSWVVASTSSTGSA